jgi:hypothetical protein
VERKAWSFLRSRLQPSDQRIWSHLNVASSSRWRLQPLGSSLLVSRACRPVLD